MADFIGTVAIPAFFLGSLIWLFIKLESRIFNTDPKDDSEVTDAIEKITKVAKDEDEES